MTNIIIRMPRNSVNDEVYDWLRTNCAKDGYKGRIYFDRDTGFMDHFIEFQCECDAIAFKLRFQDDQ